MPGYWRKLRSQQENVLWEGGTQGWVEKLGCQKSDPGKSEPEPVFLEREGM